MKSTVRVSSTAFCQIQSTTFSTKVSSIPNLVAIDITTSVFREQNEICENRFRVMSIMWKNAFRLARSDRANQKEDRTSSRSCYCDHGESVIRYKCPLCVALKSLRHPYLCSYFKLRSLTLFLHFTPSLLSLPPKSLPSYFI